MVAAVPRQLPAYALYGEDDDRSLADRLHLESIAERSRLHDWEIRPHRHEHAFQLLLVLGGRAEARLDGSTAVLTGPAAVTVPALAAHGFRFDERIEGWVLTVDERHLRTLLADEASLADTLLVLRARPLAGAGVAPRLEALTRALHDEWQGHAPWRQGTLDALLRLVLVVVARALPEADGSPQARPGRALAHVQRYRRLVDAHYREQPRLDVLAARLGITPTQLNRVCRQVLGRSALGVLHARVLLEAQRELAYTTMSVKQIGLGLGFADAAYFTRFFQRGARVAPTVWRERVAGVASPAGPAQERLQRRGTQDAE
jgi:AraC family transcriptional activator of pobA